MMHDVHLLLLHLLLLHCALVIMLISLLKILNTLPIYDSPI